MNVEQFKHGFLASGFSCSQTRIVSFGTYSKTT